MPLITHERKDAAAIVRFDNPPRGYMTMPQIEELAPVVDELARDDAVRAVVFTGAVPGVFIRHYDVASIVGIADVVRGTGMSQEALLDSGHDGNPLSHLFDRVDRLPKPTIAAINGFCMGGGFEFALCCDIRIAEKGDYTIGLPETNVGIFPGAGGTERLPRVLGEARALEMILRGRVAGPEEAAVLGLVHETVDTDALGRALQIAEEFAAKPARGIADAKHLVKSALDRDVEEGCAEARGMFSALLGEDDEAVAAMQRFLDAGEDITKV